MRVADYACSSEETFKELVHCFLSDDNQLAQRAAYSLGMAVDKNPPLIGPYVGVLVSQLKRKDVHDAVIRNTVRVLEDIEIPEVFHGEVMDACFALLQNREIAIAIRAYSMTILYQLSKVYPEIRGELRFLIEEGMPFEKPAFISRGRKILARI